MSSQQAGWVPFQVNGSGATIHVVPVASVPSTMRVVLGDWFIEADGATTIQFVDTAGTPVAVTGIRKLDTASGKSLSAGRTFNPIGNGWASAVGLGLDLTNSGGVLVYGEGHYRLEPF